MNKIVKFELDNGLKFFIEKTPGPTVSIQFCSKFGSAFESSKDSGAAHFLEHLVFTGTKKYTRQKVMLKIDEVGGEINAYTGKENTRFYTKIQPEHLERGIDVLTEITQNSIFPIKEMETERNIVLNEIRDSFDKPTSFIFDQFLNTLFKNTEFERPILGNNKTISNMKRKTVIDYYKKYYNPKNMILGISGNIEIEKTTKLIQNSFLNKGKKTPKPKFKKTKTEKREVFFERDIQQTHLCFGFQAPKTTEKEYYAFEVINAILSGGLSSKLKHEIREKRGLAYQIFSEYVTGLHHSYFVVYAATEPKKVKKLNEILLKELDLLKTKKVSPTVLKKAKQYFEGQEKINTEDSLNRAEDLIDQEIYKLPNKTKVLENIKKITAEDILKTAKQKIQTNDYSYVELRPKKQ